MTRKAKNSDALQYIHERYIGDDAERREKFDEALFFAVLAQQIYALRNAAGLTQKQLADKIDTTPSVISRLEDADYVGGHSLKTVLRILDALDCDLGLVAKPRTTKARPLARAFDFPKLALARG